MPTINKKPLILNRSTNASERQKYYGNSQWRNLRKMYLQFNPLCQNCLEMGIVTGNKLQVHHIKSPFDPNLDEVERWRRLLDWNNLKTLCPKCHANLHNMQEKMKKKQKKP